VKLEIVSHCWHYAAHLTYQLSSLVLYPPKNVKVTMTVFYSTEDSATAEVLEYFGSNETPNVQWSWRPLSNERLFRRSIGRNLAALNTNSDWIWFADADMCFRRGCIDALPSNITATATPLIYPRSIFISRTHASGDIALQAVSGRPCVQDIDPLEFEVHRYQRAIGGVQIVHGDAARRVGYNRGSERFQHPIARWQRCYDDVAFRKALGTSGLPIDLPELYRIRHEQFGRRDEFGRRTRTAKP